MPWQWLNLNFTVALYTPHSTLTLYTSHFTLHSQHFTFQTLHFTCYTPPPEPNSTLYTLHFARAHTNRNFHILQNPWLDWKFRNWGKKMADHFLSKNICFCGTVLNILWKNLVMSACPKRIRSLIKPWLTNNFSTKSKALEHERAQFALVGLFSGLGITLNFSGGDPGAKKQPKKKEKPFCKSNLLFLFLFLFLFPSLSLFLSFFFYTFN